MNHYKQLYSAFLPIPLTISSMFGIINGIDYGIDKKNKIDSFIGMIGYTSIGMITGITYPISFPLLAGYTLFQNKK